MWPSSGPLRKHLSKHLLLSGHDPIYLVNLFSQSISIKVENGLLAIKGSAIVFEASITNNNEPLDDHHISSSELTLLSLHTLWYGLSGRAPIIASFVQSQLTASPHILFWKTLYSDLAWVLTPPAIILNAMQIGRPDLQYRVQRYYMRWLQIAHSPNEIVSGIALLVAKPLRFLTWTNVWKIASKFLAYNSTQLAAVGVPSLYPPTCIVVPKPTKYQLIINTHGCLAISERDILLLLLQLLFDEEHGYVTLQRVPPDAPEQFHELAETQEYLFSKSVAPPFVNFDELDPIEPASV